jgi:CDP-2,3-bis-(O-geranylgeranyl)-sn-glycerol synthase
VANAAPLLLGGGAALDGGKNFLDGERIFGAHKTVRGLAAGIIAGSVIGLAESPVDSRLLLGGFVIALGTVLGDLLGAFFKRRIRIKPGSPLPIVDQLDFVFGGLILGQLVFPLSWWSVLIVGDSADSSGNELRSVLAGNQADALVDAFSSLHKPKILTS